MNISGINTFGSTLPYGGQKAKNADSGQLKTKLEQAKQDVKNLEKSLTTGDGNEAQIKAELAKKEQEVRDFEKKINELKSDNKETDNSVNQTQKVKSSGSDAKADAVQQTGESEMVAVSKDKSNLISGSVIDEYV